MENLSIILRLIKISFRSKYFTVTDIEERTYRIPYEELVLVYLKAHSTEFEKEKKSRKPMLCEVTGDMEGELVMLDCRRQKWCLQTELSEMQAGAILRELAIRAPYILLGEQTWFDENGEEEFEEARKMVELMRACDNAMPSNCFLEERFKPDKHGEYPACYCKKISISKNY